jgi:hemoglobin
MLLLNHRGFSLGDAGGAVAATRIRRRGKVVMAPNLPSEAAIVRLVDAFYVKVRRDELLGPVFGAAIAEAAWPVHLEKMYAFWSSVMLTSGRYKGNPMAVHLALPKLTDEMFERWLALFGETADEMFDAELAASFSGKAWRIAESLRLALFYRPELRGPRGRSIALASRPGQVTEEGSCG